MSESNLLFVYGTLRTEFENPTAQHLHSTQEYLGEGYFSGMLFIVSFFPGAVYLPEANKKVHGEVFKIVQNASDLFQKTDYYEGVGSQFSAPNEFKRAVVPVHFNGKTENAHTYLYNGSYEHYPIIESGKFTADTK